MYMFEEYQNYINKLENTVIVSNDTILKFMETAELQHDIMIVLALFNFIQPVLVLIISFWGEILDFIIKTKKKGGKNE